MNNLCTKHLIQQSLSKCEYVMINCNNQSKVAFTQHYYCLIDENYFVMLIFVPILFYTMFHFLSKTAETFLSPAVAHIAKYFKFSQTLAGITLIAFANGAPDVITAIIATGEDEQGVLIAVGSIFGSGLFMTTLVLGSVIFYSKHLLVNRAALIRDLVFNLIGISFIILFGFLGYINLFLASIFVSLYGVYIVVVMINENLEKKHCQENVQIIQHQAQDDERKGLLTDDEEKDAEPQLAQKNILQFYANEQQSLEFEEQCENLNMVEESDEEETEKEKLFSELSLPQKFLKSLTFGFDIIAKYTIPAQGKKQYNKKKTCVQLLLTPLVMLFILDGIDGSILQMPLWMVVQSVSIILTIYHLLHEIPLIVLTILSAVCSIIWCKLVVEILIDFIILIQTLTNISPSYLGMTFLAFGNSACDFLVNTELARMGLGIMAITGCFAGAFFNLNIGFGIALLKQTWSNTLIPFNLFQNDKDQTINPQTRKIIQFLLVFAFANILITIIIVFLVKFQLGKRLSFYYFSYYTIFLGFLTVITFCF